MTSPLEVPEVKQDQLKTPVKLDLLTRLSECLQELYGETQAMVAETCKCSEDLNREFNSSTLPTMGCGRNTVTCFTE